MIATVDAPTITQDIEGILDARGILQAAIEAGWRKFAYKGERGWIYPAPAYDATLYQAARWKNAHSDGKPKYVWYPGDVTCAPYYRLQPHDTSKTTLYVTSGEPDTLVLNLVYPGENILNWFGENALPASFRADCEAWGVTRIEFYMDHDDAGAAAATKLLRTFSRSAISVTAHHFPSKMGTKADLNRMWVGAKFSIEKMLEWFAAMVPFVPADDPATDDPRSEAPALLVETDYAAVWDEYCANVERDAVALWGIPARDTRGFSLKNFKSPVRKDDNPSARWNYERVGFKDFGTGEFYNTHQVADLLGFMAWADYKTDHKPAPNGHRNGKTPKPTASLTFIDSAAAMRTIMGYPKGQNLPDTQPMLAPYKPLHRLGGMARMWFPGKLILAVAPSGMGKTSFGEHLANNVQVRGEDVVFVGPEWTPEEYAMRTIARFGGPSLADQWEHVLYELDKRKGAKPDALPLNNKQRQQVQDVGEKVLQWPGQVHCIAVDKPGSGDEKPARLTPEVIIEAVEKKVKDLRAAGRVMSLIIWDYLQLFRESSDWTVTEDQMGMLKDACIRMRVVGVVFSQVLKAQEEKLMQGTWLTSADAQGISKQKPNLVLLLNPVYKDGARLEEGVIWVAKNSGGQENVYVRVKTALWRHDWTEEEVNEPEGEEIKI